MEQLTMFNGLVGDIQGKLSDALSCLVRQPVSLQLGRFGLVPFAEVERITGVTSLTSVYIPLLGDITGDIFLFMDGLASAALADLMIGNPAGTTAQIGDFEASALMELGNITSGVIVTELANRLGISIMLTVPNYAQGFAEAMIDSVLIGYAENASDAFAVNLPFSIEGHLASGFFLLLFDHKSAQMIEDKLGGGHGGE